MTDLFGVREKFLAYRYTVKNIRQDFQQWHQGRLRYAFWAIDVDCPAVREQVSIAERYLENFLLPQYQRQPHITLGISGFLSVKKNHADDYDAASFEADLAALRNLQVQPFEIAVGALASFGSAPFLYVTDPASRLQALHACLHAVTDDESFDYIPHVTVGLYAEAWPTAMISRYLDAFPHRHVTRHFIHSISLMSYTAAEIGGKLMKIADYDLASAEIQWHESLPFNHGL